MPFRPSTLRATWPCRQIGMVAPARRAGGNLGNLHLVCGITSHAPAADTGKVEGPR